MSKTIEVNFDGLVGNTHNYAGLSFGNVASDIHKGKSSSPKSAALQGLAKMKKLMDMGLTQGVLPPHFRPNMPFLKSLGFTGSDSEILQQMKKHPEYLAVSHSASSMWVANAATIAPSADTADGLVHFTPANLSSMLHRSTEIEQTTHTLKTIFNNKKYFSHHKALLGNIHSDEGAANHTRFCNKYGDTGVHLFVYGKSFFNDGFFPKKFPARQTKESFESIAMLHQLNPEYCIFAQQNPDVIDAGVFHNDVISVGNRQIFFTHEKAFLHKFELYKSLEKHQVKIIEVPDNMVSVKDAVSSYLFNSQLVSTDKGTILIAPSNCQENKAVNDYIQHLVSSDNGISDVSFFDLKQSMSNGGGPACLRLRVVLTPDELASISGNVILTDTLYQQLVEWVNKYYRESLHPSELGGVDLLNETTAAMTELSYILQLPDLYKNHI